MKRYGIFLLVLLLCGHMASAQETSSGSKARSLTNIYVSAGNYPGVSSNLSLEAFRLLAPGSALLQNDLSHFDKSRSSFFDNSWLIRAGAAFSPKIEAERQRRIRHEFRLAAVYGGGTLYSDYYWTENRYPADTFVSVKTGSIYVLDSVVTRSYGMEYNRKYLGLDASLIFYSPSWRAFSVYAGAGMSGNFDFDNHVNIGYQQYSRLEQSGATGVEFFRVRGNLNFDYEEENIPTANAFSASLFLPLGVDVKLSRHERGMGRWHLYYELRPLWRVAGIPELKAHSEFRLQHSGGLRISLN